MPDRNRKGLGGAGRYAAAAAFVAFLVAADQLTKHVITGRIFPGEVVTAVPRLVNFTNNHNTGGAFSLFPGRPIVFTLLSTAAIVLLGYLFVKLEGRTGASWAAASVMGGALGNLIDRFRLGYVIDFVDAHWGVWHWYIFNVADAAISVGALALFVFTLAEERSRKRAAARAEREKAPE